MTTDKKAKFKIELISEKIAKGLVKNAGAKVIQGVPGWDGPVSTPESKAVWDEINRTMMKMKMPIVFVNGAYWSVDVSD